MSQGQWILKVQIGEYLMFFDSIWTVFVVFSIARFTAGFIANFVEVNCLSTADYINIVRKCLFTFEVKEIFIYSQFSMTFLKLKDLLQFLFKFIYLQTSFYYLLSKMPSIVTTILLLVAILSEKPSAYYSLAILICLV